MTEIRGAVVDCAGCTAPCCRSFAVFGEKELSASTVRRRWAAGGARIRKVGLYPSGFTEWSCKELTPANTCGVYATRPTICRIYDCRADVRRYDDDKADAPARCAWPRAS